MDIKALKKILPAFPRTMHLPYKANASDDDVIAQESEAAVVFEHTLHVEEKIDGASVGMTIWEDHPLIRNRDHILKKGYVKDTPAKKQFASAWNWWYRHQDRFQKLEGFSVYGEWMKARHGIYYNRLPDWFIAYDLFEHRTSTWLNPSMARCKLQEAGFVVPKIRFEGSLRREDTLEALERMANMPAEWSEEKSEGIYIKISSPSQVLDRFKMVRQDYVRGRFWDGKTMLKNAIF